MHERDEEEQPQEQMGVAETLMAEQNQTLGEKLAANIHRTPWWMISMAAHILLLVLMALVVYEGVNEPEETTIVVSSEGTEDGGDKNPSRTDDVTEESSVSEQEVSVDQPTSDMPVTENTTASAVEVSASESTFISTQQTAVAVDISGGESFAATALKSSVGKSTGTPTSGGPMFTGAYGKTRSKGGKKKGIGKYGGKGTEKAVQDGLAWLSTHQESDGSWNINPGTEGKYKIAATSMALLAFLGDGHGESGSKYGTNVRKGVDWLLNEVDTGTGKFTKAGALYEQGLGAMALNEAYGMNIKRVKDKAVLATQYIIAGQTNKGGWNYNPGGANGDSSVTGFQVQALKQAKLSKIGIESPAEKALENARKWVEFANDTKGNTGYNSPAKGSIALTAAGGIMRIYTGSSKSDEQLRMATENIAKELPTWKAGDAGVNMYYCYYGTLLSFQWGDALWSQWNEAMKNYVLGAQCRDEGDTKGSWAAAGQWSAEWGRTGQTALSVLCLEIYYRYERFLK